MLKKICVGLFLLLLLLTGCDREVPNEVNLESSGSVSVVQFPDSDDPLLEEPSTRDPRPDMDIQDDLESYDDPVIDAVIMNDQYYYNLLESALSAEDYLWVRTIGEKKFAVYTTNRENVEKVLSGKQFADLTFQFEEAAYSIAFLLPIYDELKETSYADSPLVYTMGYNELGIVIYMEGYPEFEEYLQNHPHSYAIHIYASETFEKKNPA